LLISAAAFVIDRPIPPVGKTAPVAA